MSARETLHACRASARPHSLAALSALVLIALPVRGARAEPSFVDVTGAAGIAYDQHDWQIAQPFAETDWMSGGAAAGDYDGDGWTDLFVTRLDDADILYRNEGDGHFEDVSASAGFGAVLATNGAAWADIDNDGDLDLYVTSSRETRHFLYINDGAGHFVEQGLARDAVLSGAVPINGQSVAFGDYDGDGWLDLHVCEWAQNATQTRLLRNRGLAAPGHFEDVTVAAGLDTNQIPALPLGVFAFTSRFADLDSDGWLDLAITGDFGTSRLFWNDGDGTFSDGTVAANVGGDENGMGSAIGDLDGDGRLDWFVTAIFDPLSSCAGGACNWGDSGNRLYRNLGARQFQDVTDARGVRDGGWGWGAAFLDYDNDGDLDLSMANGQIFSQPGGVVAQFNANPQRLWRNDGPGTMADVAALTGADDTGPGKGMLVFDYDEDGDLDLFLSVNGEAPVLLRNDGADANGWLRVRAVHARSGRDAIGARIEVVRGVGESPMLRELFSGSHFLSQSEVMAHFGLGGQTSPVHEVRVYAPGAAQPSKVFADVTPNQTLVVTVGATPVPLLAPGGAALLAVVLSLGAWTRLAQRGRSAARKRHHNSGSGAGSARS
jgi:hypothetical protein